MVQKKTRFGVMAILFILSISLTASYIVDVGETYLHPIGSDDQIVDNSIQEDLPPEPPSNLTVKHTNQAFDVVFEDHVVNDLGYTTGQSSGASEWGIRDIDSISGNYSWDFGNGSYEDPEKGGLSWLITPEIDLSNVSAAELTFMHWRDFEDESRLWDGGNLKISTNDIEGPWHLMEKSQPGYDGILDDAWDNPLGGEPAWGYSLDWEEVFFDLSDYEDESIWVRWEAGVDNYKSDHQGWRIDEIVVSGDVSLNDDKHNLLTWDASSDDPGDVSHYNIYRSDDHDGPWNESTLIANITAEDSGTYQYTDLFRGLADDISWCYLVRAVGTNDIEENNTEVATEIGYTSTFDISLYAGGDFEGWNFVSFDLIPKDTSLTEILHHPEYGIGGKYNRLMYFDASNDEWLTYVPGRSEIFNNLRYWDHTMGIWINMEDDATLIIEGSLPTITDITLYPGWNMVGFPDSSHGNQNLPSEVSLIGYFEGKEEYNIAYADDPTSFVFYPGYGYWIHNSADHNVDWTIE